MEPARKTATATPRMPTAMGVPASEPPGQRRCAGHTEPAAETAPIGQAFPGAALQAAQLEEPTFEKEPAGHAKQVEDEEAPSSAENVPAGHAEQLDNEDAPSCVENVPARHAEQDVAPLHAENLPAGHAEQEEVAPSSAENLPALHDSHTSSQRESPSGLYLPAGHAG